ncbi:hypothetical protein H0H87_011275 [Tephrocybe sp. NHM501043]|nr:hypothetical protein H0H87_011275 [Tephrocybe sp. NHM501043]
MTSDNLWIDVSIGPEDHNELDANGHYKDVQVMEIIDSDSDSEQKVNKDPKRDKLATHLEGLQGVAILVFFNFVSETMISEQERDAQCRPMQSSINTPHFVDTLLQSIRASTGGGAKLDTARSTMEQPQICSHFQTLDPSEWKILYSDEVFKDAAIEWMTETDQPIQAFEHLSSSIKMIVIASRATGGVKLPDRKQTWSSIIALFKEQMQKLQN